MKLKPKNILMIVLVLALVVLVIVVAPKKRYKWNIHSTNMQDGQPYSIDLLETFLEKSLANGYGVKKIDVYYEDEGDVVEDPLKGVSTDTALFFINRYPLSKYHDDLDLSIVKPLLNFAKRGGQVVYVGEVLSELTEETFKDILNDLNVSWAIDYVNGDYLNSRSGVYSKDWMRKNPSWEQEINVDGRKMEIDNKLLINCFRYSPRHLENYNIENASKERITPMLTYDHDLGNEKRAYDPEHYIDDRKKDIFENIKDIKTAYALDVYFPQTGGHFYITSLHLFFTNLGLVTPGGPEMIAALMDKVDDRPVARIVSTYTPKKNKKSSNGDADALTVLSRNPALSFAWILILIFVACILLSGLMRKHPASKTPDVDDVDKTDLIAVRNQKFRRSPLLHFLYQISWLYRSDSDYRELFDVNFRRLARIVKKHTGVELETATPEALRDAAEYFSRLQRRPAEEVLDDLQWMRQVHIPIDTLNKDYFKYSQDIVETFDP